MDHRTSKKQYLSGMRAGLPVILGFIPVGIAFAVMARQAGFSPGQTCAMSITVFAGASQMMAVGMFQEGAGIAAIILATFILNLRHLIMSICVFERMDGGRLPVRLLAGFGVTDESFAIYTTQKKENCTVVFFLGLITVTYLSWNAGTLLGVILSDFLPPVITASLGIALYAMFIGLLTPNLAGNFRLAVLVVFTALCNSLLRLLIPSSWALIVSTLVGAFVGVFFADPDGNKEAAKNGVE